jgi:hypothetical protein
MAWVVVSNIVAGQTIIYGHLFFKMTLGMTVIFIPESIINNTSCNEIDCLISNDYIFGEYRVYSPPESIDLE